MKNLMKLLADLLFDKILKLVRWKNKISTPLSRYPKLPKLELYDFRKKCAFTLAEVLIVITIIGLVATMTLPNLMQEYRKKVAITKIRRMMINFNHAIALAEAEYGDRTYWYGDAAEEIPLPKKWPWGANSDPTKVYRWYMKYLYKNLRPTKITCDTSATQYCPMFMYPDGTVLSSWNKYDWYFSTNPRYKKSKKGTQKFYFNYCSTCTKTVYVGWSKLSNNFDAYVFAVTNVNDFKTLKNNGTYGCYKGGGWYCARLIQSNGWKIPDDYPYKF